MKKIILQLLLLTGISSQAQYFKHIYGSGDHEEAFSGMVTTQVGQGFVIAGTRNAAPPSLCSTINSIAVVRTNIQGDITGSSHFEKNYSIYTDNGLSQLMRVRQVHVVELSSTRFALAGVCFNDATLTKMSVFYTLIDQAGNVIPSFVIINGFPYNVHRYNAGQNDFYEVHSILLAPSGTELYIVGRFTDANTGKHYSMVLKVDVAIGNVIWAGFFDLGGSNDVAYDAVENTITNELVVVGSYLRGSTEAFILRLDPSNGTILGNAQIFGNSNTEDTFKTIAMTASGGYIIGGRTGTIPGNTDTWVLSMDNAFNVHWNFQYDYSGSGDDEDCNDIMERINTLGNPEVYTAGKTDPGLFGGQDMLVYMIDGATGSCLRELPYGSAQNDWAVRIDQENTGTAQGFSLYGVSEYIFSPYANKELTILKNYFNGISACTFDGALPSETNGPNLNNTPYPIVISEFVDEWAWLQQVCTMTDLPQCYANSVVGGSNQREIDVSAPSPYNTLLYPNPTNGLFNINPEGVERIEVYDVLGNLVMERSTNGEKTEIDLENNADGVYMVYFMGAGMPQVFRIVKSTGIKSKN
jgi:hypothetical protein